MNNKLISGLCVAISFGILALVIDPITDKLAALLKSNPTVIINKPNVYYKEANYLYVKQTEDFIPYSSQALKDVFFSILNNGYETFTFYCPVEYPDCIKDVHTLSSDADTLTHINNYVSPFNNFKNIRVIYDETGEVTIEIEKLYTNEEITTINNELDKIINQQIKPEMDLEEQILTIHNYIINKTQYDVKKIDGKSTYRSNTAYGPIIEGHAICGGYADAMALFLNRLKVPNFKVASSTHVWNAVFLEGNWLHLDLTWDDPVDEGNRSSNNLIHKFYLISTATLEDYQITDHDFPKIVYQEMVSK